MRRVGAYEAKTHLPRLLEDVRNGEEVIITRHGTPIARLIPAGERGAMSVADAIKELKRLRRGQRLD